MLNWKIVTIEHESVWVDWIRGLELGSRPRIDAYSDYEKDSLILLLPVREILQGHWSNYLALGGPSKSLLLWVYEVYFEQFTQFFADSMLAALTITA